MLPYLRRQRDILLLAEDAVERVPYPAVGRCPALPGQDPVGRVELDALRPGRPSERAALAAPARLVVFRIRLEELGRQQSRDLGLIQSLPPCCRDLVALWCRRGRRNGSGRGRLGSLVVIVVVIDGGEAFSLLGLGFEERIALFALPLLRSSLSNEARDVRIEYLQR